MMVKSLLIMAGWCASFYFMLAHGSWLAAALLGFFCAEIGVSIMHDGNHGSYSRRPWLNRLAGMGMDLIGASAMAWEYQHVVGHHPFTNLITPGSDTAHIEKDPDVFSSYPFVRMHPESQPPKWFHRFQHIYAPVLFALFTMAKVIYSDFVIALSQAVCHIPMTSRFSNGLYITRFFGMKALTLTLMLGGPVYVHGWAKGLGLYTLAHCCCGEFLALMFIVTHVTEGSSFITAGAPVRDTARQRATCASGPAAGRAAVKPNDWAALQCRTSFNWGLSSWLWSHLSGGLNHQVEHHLFPGICHVHYPSIRAIVQGTCAEFGVPYMAHDSLTTAIGSMLSHLKIMGRVELEQEYFKKSA
jgi:fatty acid desaturase